MVLSYIKTDEGGCTYYRSILPFMMVNTYTDWTIHECAHYGDVHKFDEQLKISDFIMMQRSTAWQVIEFIKEAYGDHKKVIVDYDDDYFKITPFSPHYHEWGLEEVKIDLQGKIIDLWKDGHNIDIKANEKRREDLLKCVKMADMVTVTNSNLKNTYRKYNKNVQILPNCTDPKLWARLPLPKDDKIRLFWSGGASHFEDWSILTDILPKIVDRHKNVRLVLMGTKFEGTLKKIKNQDRLEFHPWVHTQAYPYHVRTINPDIGIIPLVKNPFNIQKSPIKWIEYAGLSMPSVSSLVQPYSDVAQDRNGIFIEKNDPDAWEEGINLLIENEELRKEMGDNARKYMEEKFDIRKKYHLWYDKYKALYEGETK